MARIELGTFLADPQPDGRPPQSAGSPYRVVHLASGAGFFGRAYHIAKESLLHPLTPSYLVVDQKLADR